MNDQVKTHQLRIEESSVLKQRIRELEQLEARHRRAEKELRIKDMQLRTILESTADGILAVDTAGNVIKTNQKFVNLWNIPFEILGKGTDEALLKYVVDQLEDPGPFLEKVRALYESPMEDFDTILCRDGRIVERYSYPLLSEGVITGRVWSFRDITERKKAEKALRDSEERYRILVENASDIVFRTDDAGYFTFINPAGLHITEYEEREMIGKQYSTFIRPDMRDNTMKFYGRQFVKGIQNTYLEYPLLTKSGHELWLGQNTQLIMEDGRVVGFQAVARDITDRKQAEKALKDSESKYQFLAENMADVVFTVDLNLVTTYVSPSIERMLGYTPEERMAQKADQQLTAASQKLVAEALLEELGRENAKDSDPDRSRTMELEYYHKDGSIRHLVTYIRGIRDSEGKLTGFYGSHHDVTERKRGEKLRQTLDMLRKTIGTTIQVMVSAVEARDPYTAGHQNRCANLARAIATEMGLSQEKIEAIRMAGSVHDIGKLSIPAEILSKPSRLSKGEIILIKEHSQKGYEILKDVESPWPLAEIVHQHHERIDGSGYPRNLKGDDILVEARILAVADVVESMASHRPYRPALGLDAALEEIENNRGILYDKAVVDACLKLFQGKDFNLNAAVLKDDTYDHCYRDVAESRYA